MRLALFRAGMLAYGARYWVPLKYSADTPDRVQARVLRRILRANATTAFGGEHRFANVVTHQDYIQQVPVQDYESLRGYIDEQRKTGARTLTAEAPMFYAQTSGSTGAPKYIPVTATTLRQYRDEQALFMYLQHRACPEAFSGRALGIMGAAVEDRLDTGHQVGSVSGYLYESLPASVRARFVVPPSVSAIADYDVKYLVILRLALAARDVTYLGSPNPSTFLRLLSVLDEHRDLLARSLESGRFDQLDTLDSATRAVLAPQLQRDPVRAADLRAAKPLTFAALWPRIKLITTWTGGSCGVALEKLRKMLPADTKVMELGYQSTEFRGTLALEADAAAGLPPLHHHFFEFAERAQWDAGQPRFLTLGQLDAGASYYVLVTTAAGLYRYFMNDLVEVSGRFERTPLLKFVQKGKGVTSLTGEKLYEGQVIQAVRETARQYGFSAPFFLLVASDHAPAYTLFVERDAGVNPPLDSIAAEVERRLGQLNVEYHAKRASGRLAPLTVSWVSDGAAEAYKAACIRRGQRESQFKPVVLQYERDLALPLDAYVVP